MRTFYKCNSAIMLFAGKVIRRLHLKKAAEILFRESTLFEIYGASDEKIISMIGDKSHKLLQQALGQQINSNQIYLETLLEQARQRNIKNKIITWGENTYKSFSDGSLYKTEKYKEENQLNTVKLQNFYELTKKRQSIRKFSSELIPKPIVEKIIQCAIEAPCSCNRQSWRFITFSNKTDKEFIALLRNVDFLKNAALIICILVDSQVYYDKNEFKMTSLMDASAAAMNILYACTVSNLGSCWVNFAASVNKKRMQPFLKRYKIDDNYKPISLVAVGFPSQSPPKPQRDDLEKYWLASYE